MKYHPGTPLPDTMKDDYRLMNTLDRRLMPKFVEALERHRLNPRVIVPEPYDASPFPDGRTNRYLDGRHPGTAPLLERDTRFAVAPNGFLRIQPRTVPENGLPVGSLGRTVTASLLKGYATLVDGLDDFHTEVQRDFMDLTRTQPELAAAISGAVRRATFWGREAKDTSPEATADAIDHTYTDGLFTAVQALTWLTSHGLDSYQGREGELLVAVGVSGVVNALTAKLPFAVMSPLVRNGELPTYQPLFEDEQGFLLLDPPEEQRLIELRKQWRQWAHMTRDHDPGRSTAGMPCVAADQRAAQERFDMSNPDPTPLGRMSRVVVRRAIELEPRLMVNAAHWKALGQNTASGPETTHDLG